MPAAAALPAGESSPAAAVPPAAAVQAAGVVDGGVERSATAGSRPEVGSGRLNLLRLVLWRHGQTTYNAEHRFQGQRDVPLNAVGRAQAHRAARDLATLAPTQIWSSDLVRASATAGYLARLTGLEVRLDKDLQIGRASCRERV